jgi:hypothetical protein
MAVTSTTTKITQVLAIIGQLANQFGGFIPVAWQPVVAISLGILQGVGALIAHFSTPAGAPLPVGSTVTTPTGVTTIA